MSNRGLLGLQNLGNTCYINGAIQALSNCPRLTRFMLDCPSSTGISHSYSELIKEMWNPLASDYVVPTNIIRNIKFIYPAFRGCTQQDTQEFLRCFLEQLHDELKQPIVPNNSTISSVEGDSEEDATKDASPVNDDNLRSIISDIFEFKISSSVVCSSCNNVSTTKETFKDLSIPIPTRDHPYYQPVNNQNDLSEASPSTNSDKVSDSSLNEDETHQSPTQANHQPEDQEEDEVLEDELEKSSYLTRWFWDWLLYFSDWIWGPKVTLQDCLSIFFGTDPLEGDNEYSCEVCTKKNKGVKFLKIIELPEVLCIHFKRYESIGSAKITTHVSFPLNGLDLAPFMSEDSKPQCTTYNLIACICHHGSALLTGHYTTYALNCHDDQWYEFDDQYVTGVHDYQVENSEAYILFYQKSSLDFRTDESQSTNKI